MGAPRTRPLHPASPAHCRSGLREERADHRERAAWGSRGGRARAAPSFPLPSALGPRGPRRSEKMALHFQVSAPAAGLELRRWRAARGVGGPRPRPRASTAPCPGTASWRRAALAHPSPPSSAWAAATSGQVGAGAEGPPGSPHAQPAVGALLGSLGSEAGAAGARERGSAARGLSLAGGGRAGRGPARPGARSLIGGASGQGAGCAGGVHLPGGSGAQRVFVPPASTEPPHWCTVAERSGASRQHQLPPLSF